MLQAGGLFYFFNALFSEQTLTHALFMFSDLAGERSSRRTVGGAPKAAERYGASLPRRKLPRPRNFARSLSPTLTRDE